MNRHLRIAGAVLAATVAMAGLVGCGRLREQPADTDLPWDAQALLSVGMTTDDVVAAPDDQDGTTPHRRHPRLRYLFQHTLHGEATVQTDEGTITVVAQRGTVTEITDDSVSVRSSDGYSLTWQLSDRTVVVVDRARSEIGNVAVGAKFGFAGSRDGDAVTARLLVVPRS